MCSRLDHTYMKIRWLLPPGMNKRPFVWHSHARQFQNLDSGYIDMNVSGAASHLQVDRCEAAASRKQHSCPPRLPSGHAHTKVLGGFLFSKISEFPIVHVPKLFPLLHRFQNYFCFCSRTFPSHGGSFFRLQWEFQWENGQKSFFGNKICQERATTI